MNRGKSRARGWATALLFAALAAPVRGDEAYDPYRIPRAQFHEQVKRVALRPLRLPDGTPDAERVRSEFERLIAAELERRGYAVVPSSAFRETWLRFATDLGGVFDPVTGRPDPQREELAWQHTARELERSQNVDAVLAAEIAFDVMPAGIGFWYWEAAEQPLRWRGHNLLSAPNQQPQRVEGAYLGALIFDPARVPLYDIRFPLAWSRVYLAGGYEERPTRELYADHENNQETVQRLLESLDRKAGDGDGS